MMAMDEKAEALKFMRLIAEGYFSAAIDDRFVRVENPKFREDNGEDPYLIFDTAPENCPVCDKPFKPDDLCSTDIELGVCHAACLEGCPTVDLNTGDPVDGPIPTYRYDEDMTWAKINDPAALSSVQPVPVVTIKPLEWEPNSPQTPNSLWVNVPSIGRHYTIDPESNVFRVETQLALSEYGPESLGLHPTLEAAKTAAQNDFEARVRPLLLPTPQPVEGPREPVADTEHIVGRAASVICEVGALCGWPGPECKSEEAAQALFAAGLLATPPLPAQGTVERAEAVAYRRARDGHLIDHPRPGYEPLFASPPVDSSELKALQSALGLCDLAATLTGCRGDDDYVNDVREQINAALSSQGSR